jgi:hypothetical protein
MPRTQAHDVLHVSHQCYAEIKRLLEESGHANAVRYWQDDEVLVMDGLALKVNDEHPESPLGPQEYIPHDDDGA